MYKKYKDLSFPCSAEHLYSHYEFISSAGYSAVQKNVLFIKQTSAKFL